MDSAFDTMIKDGAAIKKGALMKGERNITYFLHGGDYNPEQWIATKEIWDEDMRLMRLANCNTMSVGIFSWSMIEPQEGVFDFSLTDEIIGKIKANGGKVILATPSAAMPSWLGLKYKEVLKVDRNGIRQLYGGRQRFCPSSPIYREKVRIINEKLAERYGNDDGVLLWHISNEYYGEACFCELCQERFRSFLKNRYGTIKNLNHEYWSNFWSHTYSSFEEIDCRRGSLPLGLDWDRFTSEQYIDFMKAEISAVRKYSDKPTTTNMMPCQYIPDYYEMAKFIDIASWDNYPEWHSPAHLEEAVKSAFWQDFFRSLKQKPFLLMESSPGCENWKTVNKLKEDGMDTLASMQAVAHGSDSVMYFQWRKSRGDYEKFHGAVVDHVGTEHTRIFKAVSHTGDVLKKISEIAGTNSVKSEVAIVYDFENRRAFCRSQFGANKDYCGDILQFYKYFWNRAVPCDIVSPHSDLSQYKLVVVVDQYMVDKTTKENFKKYVSSGGTLYSSCFLGMANENDLCHLGGFPCGELKDVFGIWNEELDSYYPNDKRSATIENREYAVKSYAEHIHAENTNVLGVYNDGLFAGEPCYTVNDYGKGKAYYQAFFDEGDFKDAAFDAICSELSIESVLPTIKDLPFGVTAHARTNGANVYVFVENYTDKDVVVPLNGNYMDMLTGKQCSEVAISRFGVGIYKK